jgi:hypothetical protein
MDLSSGDDSDRVVQRADARALVGIMFTALTAQRPDLSRSTTGSKTKLALSGAW